ncbi:MAG: hypothetical protein IKV78_02625 [Methanocorpusculum sp.]|nr:hypothetical protein [Methanocorpusculum sp.]
MNNTNGKKGPVCFEDLDFRFKTHFEIINRKSKSSQQQSTRLVGCAKKRNVLITQGQGTAKNGLYVTVNNNNNLTGYAGAFSGAGFIQSNAEYGGVFSLGSYKGAAYQGSGGSPGYLLNINVNHGHTGSISSSDIETKPINYTYKVWKRTV